ncbi:MAG: DNA internalization-related competence protein ComEC/Rec2 [Candidatus Alcyoniella australis]|nr:DNA internalization-related competence protein ComEC/Rec2 [Candidatus Alcyoniella australis]
MIKRPMTLLALALVGAILLGEDWPGLRIWALCGAVLAAAATLWAALRGRRGLLGPLLLAALALWGMGRGAHLAAEHPLAEPFDVQGRPLKATVQGLVLRDARGLSDPARLLILVEGVKVRGRELEGQGARAMLTVYQGQVQSRVGDRVRFYGRVKLPTSFRNPGCFDIAAYERRRGIELLGSLADARDLELLQPAAAWPLRRALEDLRGRIRSNIVLAAPGDAAAVLCALVLGETGMIDEALRETFIHSGAAHLLAISGTHVAALLAFVSVLVMLIFKARPNWLLRVDARKVAALCCTLTVAGYVLLADLRITALRAAIMFGVAALALISDRLRDLTSAVSLAVVVILLIWPGSLFEPGFQLSFCAVTTLALYLGWLRRRRSRLSELKRLELTHKPHGLLRGVAHLAGVSLALVLGTAPVSAAHFGQVAPGAIVANMAAMPLVGLLVVPLGLCGAMLSLVWPAAGSLLIALAGALIQGLIPFLEAVAELPGAYLTLAPPRPLQVALLLAALLAVALERPRRLWLHCALILAALAGLFEVGLWARNRLDNSFRVEALDVGQGLCLLLRFPHGRAGLIDGGGMRIGEMDIGEVAVLPYLRHERIRKLEFVLATHPHPDHFRGLQSVLRSLKVDEFWRSRFDHTEPQADLRYRELLELVQRLGIRQRELDMESPPIEIGGVRLAVLLPPPAREDLRGWTLNDKSVVLKAALGEVSFLLGADMEQHAERRLLQSDFSLQSTVFLAPHHGSDTSSSEALLAAVHPKHALISAGRFNSYGLPSPRVIKRLQRLGIRVWRTDLDGLVSIKTDGNRLDAAAAAGREAQR